MQPEKTADRNIDQLLFADSKTLVPEHQREAAEKFFCAHVGTSMNPTLSKQDILEIVPYKTAEPQVGDVVLNRPSLGNSYIVHRIISKNRGCFQTRGDSNSSIDPWAVKKDHIYGRVIAAHRGKKRRKIASGCMGSIEGKLCRMRRIIFTIFISPLAPVYRSFCTGGILHWLIPFRLQPHVVFFKTGSNCSYKLLLGKLVIGTYDEVLSKWQIKRPYRLFINESSLPAPQ